MSAGRRDDAPEDALDALAEQLRDEGSVISPHVVEPGATRPSLGLLAAAGPRARGAPASTRSSSRRSARATSSTTASRGCVAGADPDLALLAGDYLYALGLERLAALGDLEAVRELSDLISPLGAAPRGATTPTRRPRSRGALAGRGRRGRRRRRATAHERAKAALRAARPTPQRAAAAAARERPRGPASPSALADAAEAIGLRAPHLA